MDLTSTQKRFLNEWMDFLKIPSVSADPEFKNDVKTAAEWVKNALQKAGCLKTEIIKTPGHPIVYGEYLIDSSLPTVLVYGHCDNLEEFVKNNKEKLNCDIILISDTGMISKTQPSISTGLRGLSYMEVTVTGPNRDLHSGLYGGSVANPINILCDMIAKLHDEDRKVTIPGFYDRVEELSQEDRNEMAKAPFDLEEFKSSIGINAVQGEAGYNNEERRTIRPTLDVNGIWGGYIGEGAKTVIASKAHAKISMRLVPDQEWNEISDLFSNYFTSLAPEGVKVEVLKHHGGYAYVTPTDTIGYQAAHKAYNDTFGIAPIPSRGGGSIPIVPMFEKELGVKSILMGFGLDSDAIHSPNEHYGLFNFFKGIETIPRFYHHYIALLRQQ
jgi:acetylornithine deacetylase/succinyl-diaminopimelate desuccinylase-like protein